MRRLMVVLLAAALLGLTGCGAGVRIYSDVDPGASFGSYETYAFQEWSEGNQEVITQMERERIRVAVANELEKHGLSYDAEDPDLQVKITVYFREAERAMQTYPYYPYHPYSYYHYGWPMDGGRYHYMERALVVDIYEGEEMDQIWHGAAVGEIRYSPGKRAEVLPAQVAKLFEKYPV